MRKFGLNTELPGHKTLCLIGLFVSAAVCLLFTQCNRCSRIDPPTSASEQHFDFRFVATHSGQLDSSHDLVPDSIPIEDVLVEHPIGISQTVVSDVDSDGIHVFGPFFYYDSGDAVGITLEKDFHISDGDGLQHEVSIEYRVAENKCGHKYLVSIRALIDGAEWFDEPSGSAGYIESQGERTTITFVID